MEKLSNLKLKKYEKYVAICLLLILVIPTASAVSFRRGAYRGYQRIQFAYETLIVEKNEQDIQFWSEMLINDTTSNLTNSITFIFSPADERKVSVKRFNYHIDVVSWNTGETIKPNVTVKKDNFSNYVFNVSVKGFNQWTKVSFYANATLTNLVTPTRKYNYRLFYYPYVDTEEYQLSILLPFKYVITAVNLDYNFPSGSLYQTVQLSKENSKKPIYVYFEDEFERETAEYKKNIFFLFMGTVFSLITTVAYEWFMKKNIIGEIKVKKFKNHKTATIKVFKKK